MYIMSLEVTYVKFTYFSTRGNPFINICLLICHCYLLSMLLRHWILPLNSFNSNVINAIKALIRHALIALITLLLKLFKARILPCKIQISQLLFKHTSTALGMLTIYMGRLKV